MIKIEKPKTVPDWIDIIFKIFMLAISIVYFVFLFETYHDLILSLYNPFI